MTQYHIHQLRPTLGDLASASTRMVQQAQAVFLHLEELLVGIEDLAWARTGFQDKPLLGVPKHLLEVALLGHGATPYGTTVEAAS
jgi:hypothetical protein